jgi:hypothetical protein
VVSGVIKMNWIKLSDEDFVNLDKVIKIEFTKKKICFFFANNELTEIENTESNRKKVLIKIDMINSTIGNVLGGFK